MSEDDPWGGKNGDAPDPWAVSIATGSAPKPKEKENPQKGWKNFTTGKAEMPEDLQGSKSSGKVKSSKVKAMPSGPNLPRTRVTEKKLVGKVLEWKGKYGWIQPSEVVQHPKAYKHGGKIFVSVTDCGGIRQLYPGSSCTFYVFEDEAGLGAEDVVVTDEGSVVGLGRGKNNFSGSKGGSKGGKGGRGAYDAYSGRGGGAGRSGGCKGGMQTGIIPGLEPEHLGLGRAQGTSRSGPPGGIRPSQPQQGHPGQDSSFGGRRGGGGGPAGGGLGRGGRGRDNFGDGSSGPSGGFRGRDSGHQPPGGGRGGLGRGSGSSGGPSGGVGRGGFSGGCAGFGAFDRNPGGPGFPGAPRPPAPRPPGGDGWDPLMGQTLHMDRAVGAAGASGGTAGIMAPMPSALPSMAMGGMGGLPMGSSAPVGMSAPGPGIGAIGPPAMGFGGAGVIGGMAGMPDMGGMNAMGGMSAMGNLGQAAMPGSPGYSGFGQLGQLAAPLGAPGASAPGPFGGQAQLPANDLMPNPWWPGR